MQYLGENYKNINTYLKEKHGREISQLEHFKAFNERDYKCNYQIKKYADKLKDIVCLLIGCTRADLEDREFKEKELGEEWNIWVLVPDPDHNLFEGTCQLTERIFPVKEEVEKFIKEHKIINVLKIEERALTPRKLLQILGTNCGRDIIHPNIWINSLFADYKPVKCKFEKWCECSATYDHNDVVERQEWWQYADMDTECMKGSRWIITDVRFPNEAQAIKDRGGIVIRVNRFHEIDKAIEHKAIIPHTSETSLDNYEFDYVVDNNSDISSLIEKIKALNIV